MQGMIVYILHRYHDTPDNEGNDILGVYYDRTDAQRDMAADAVKTKAFYPAGFWTGDMTWETEDEIHLCHNPADAGSATIHCWKIIAMDVS